MPRHHFAVGCFVLAVSLLSVSLHMGVLFVTARSLPGYAWPGWTVRKLLAAKGSRWPFLPAQPLSPTQLVWFRCVQVTEWSTSPWWLWRWKNNELQSFFCLEFSFICSQGQSPQPRPWESPFRCCNTRVVLIQILEISMVCSRFPGHLQVLLWTLHIFFFTCPLFSQHGCSTAEKQVRMYWGDAALSLLPE